MGGFVIALTFLAFAAGHLRNELALTLLAAVFLAVLAYCFASVFLFALLQRRRLLSVSAGITAKIVTAGDTGELRVTAKERFFRFPGILVRYELRLHTLDGRVIRGLFNPGRNAAGEIYSFPVRERGAYYGPRDRLGVFDAPGLFRLSLPIPQGEEPRLFAAPVPAEEPVPLPILPGGQDPRREPRYLRTEDLTDHRPYLPGDDPRRINWKLYGHAGDLFIREGEPEPPPHSRLVILLDTQVDPDLYDPEAGRRAVDLLCGNALAAAREFSGRGIEVSLDYTGSTGGPPGGRAGRAPEFAPALARPAALPVSAPLDFPPLPERGAAGLAILALPRTRAGPSALDRFLKTRGPDTRADLWFIYEEGAANAWALRKAAETCAALYGGKPGIRARSAGARLPDKGGV
jgi:hypothetical protein